MFYTCKAVCGVAYLLEEKWPGTGSQFCYESFVCCLQFGYELQLNHYVVCTVTKTCIWDRNVLSQLGGDPVIEVVCSYT